MRLHKIEGNKIQEIVKDVIAKLTSNTKSVTISTAELTKLPKIKEKDKLTLHFTDKAHHKMKALVNNCSEEIAWHGTVERLNKLFVVKDILVYPQTATRATVESHDDYYPSWLDSLDDNVFNSIRMQGHSHVDMGVSPSTTDLEFYDTLIEHIQDYYVFIIMNKSGNIWVNIYDIPNNTIYEKDDINITYVAQSWNEWFEKQYALYMHEPEPVVPYYNYNAKKTKKDKQVGISPMEQAYLRALGTPYTLNDIRKATTKRR